MRLSIMHILAVAGLMSVALTAPTIAQTSEPAESSANAHHETVVAKGEIAQDGRETAHNKAGLAAARKQRARLKQSAQDRETRSRRDHKAEVREDSAKPDAPGASPRA